MPTPLLNQLTPVMVVDRVEPCMAFWVERFGFTAENEVPGPDGALVFASARSGAVEVMYQTTASILAETPAMHDELRGHSITLFIQVSDFEATERALAGAEVVKPRHQTSYGSTEMYVREPGGNMVGFASFA